MSNHPGLSVQSLNHIAICVFDVEASVSFYENIIGLRRLPRPDFGDRGAWFAIGDSQGLHILVDETGKGLIGRDLTHFALMVDDVRAACAYLGSQGVEIAVKPQVRPDGFGQAVFVDPDGYKIELVSRPSED
jgi:catechol 2,3-dioxygenase-like lactoylglutathione lyase family enzyme